MRRLFILLLVALSACSFGNIGNLWYAASKKTLVVPTILSNYPDPGYVATLAAAGETFSLEHRTAFAADGNFTRWVHPYTTGAQPFPTVTFLQDTNGASGTGSALTAGNPEFQAWTGSDGTWGTDIGGASLAGTMTATVNAFTVAPTSYTVAAPTGSSGQKQTATLSASDFILSGSQLVFNGFGSADVTGKDYLVAPAITATGGTGTLTATLDLLNFNATSGVGTVFLGTGSNIPSGASQGSFGNYYRPAAKCTANQRFCIAFLANQTTIGTGISLRLSPTGNKHYQVQCSGTTLKIFAFADFRTGGSPNTSTTVASSPTFTQLTVSHIYIVDAAAIGTSTTSIYATLFDYTLYQQGTPYANCFIVGGTNGATPLTGSDATLASTGGQCGWENSATPILEAESFSNPVVATPPSVTLNNTGVVVSLAGNGTTWTPASTTQFSITNSGTTTGASITSQLVSSSTAATVTLSSGSTGGTLTLTDGTNSFVIVCQPMVTSQAAASLTNSISVVAAPTFLNGPYEAQLWRSTNSNSGTTGAPDPTTDPGATKVYDQMGITAGVAPTPYVDSSPLPGCAFYTWRFIDNDSQVGISQQTAVENGNNAVPLFSVWGVGDSILNCHVGGPFVWGGYLTIVSAGSGYSQGTTTLTINGIPGATAACTVTGGVITNAWFTNPGFGNLSESSLPTCTVNSSSGGGGAVITVQPSGGAMFHMQQALMSRYGWRNFLVSDCAVIGATSRNWEPHGVDSNNLWLLKNAENAIQSLDPSNWAHSVLIIAVGSNDATTGGTSAATYQSNVQAIITGVRSDGFLGPILLRAPIFRPAATQAQNYLLQTYRSSLQTLSNTNANVYYGGSDDPFSNWVSIGNPTFTTSPWFGTDSIHPSAYGQAFIGSEFASWMIFFQNLIAGKVIGG